MGDVMGDVNGEMYPGAGGGLSLLLS